MGQFTVLTCLGNDGWAKIYPQPLRDYQPSKTTTVKWEGQGKRFAKKKNKKTADKNDKTIEISYIPDSNRWNYFFLFHFFIPLINITILNLHILPFTTTYTGVVELGGVLTCATSYFFAKSRNDTSNFLRVHLWSFLWNPSAIRQIDSFENDVRPHIKGQLIG